MKQIKQLSIKWNEKKDIFNTNLAALKKNKTEIFESKDLNRWEIDLNEIQGEFKEITNNKDVAFKYILPKATQETFKSKQFFFYFSHCLLEEFNRAWNSKVKNLKGFVIDLSQKAIQHNADV